MIVRKDSDQASYTDIQQFSGQNVVGQLGTNYDDVIDRSKASTMSHRMTTIQEMVLPLQNGDVERASLQRSRSPRESWQPTRI